MAENKNKRVVVGMSGGVDSSVAAYILKEQGYDVIGVTLKLWEDKHTECDIDNGGCCGLSGIEDAKRVAHMLDIPHYVLNFKDRFKEKVVDYFINEYLKGNTPNPCIACNRYIKWDYMLHKALELGVDYVATGHYARISYDDEAGRYLLKKSVTAEKDQTYALYGLTQEQLSRTLMPVGDFTKDEVRVMASNAGLKIAQKPDSQDICFVPDGNYGDFIRRNSSDQVKKGHFVDTKGNIIGEHKGIMYYTIGQRKNLGQWFGKRIYVKSIDAEANTVILGENEELFDNELIVKDINLIALDSFKSPVNCTGKIRYNQKAADCEISLINNCIYCNFKSPQRAITPGQAAVFYLEDVVLGGGTIVNK